MTARSVDPVQAAAVACELASEHASAVDAENRFPSEAIGALRDSGLLGLLVPATLGGLGGSFADAAQIARDLGSGCLSTALIWAMHCQQVTIMADHAADQWSAELRDIAARGALIASATTEPDKPGILTTARAAIDRDGDRLLIERPSPTVSYGSEADYFLVTLRGGPQAAETDVRYVLLDRGQAVVIGDWDAMGMRGTRSVPMRFSGRVPERRLLVADFRRVAVRSAIPAAHLGWTSAWLGGARGGLDRFVLDLREGGAASRRRLSSDLFVTRLGEVRLKIDLLEAMLVRLLERYEAMRGGGAPDEAYDDADWTITLNGVKVAGSRLAFEAVDILVGLAGLSDGYLRGSRLALERLLRDLRSAALMVSNDRLLQLNAKRLVLSSMAE